VSGLPRRRFPPSTPYTSRRFTLVATLTVLAVLLAVVTSRPDGAASEQANDLDTTSSLAEAAEVSAEAVAAAPTTEEPSTSDQAAAAEAPSTEAPTTEPPTSTPPPVPAPSAPNPGPWPGPMQVALTFDDGPDPTWTEQILDVLDQYQVPATFFVLGTNADRWPGLVAEMARRGHSVQNHSWGHPYLTQISDDGVLGQLSGTSDLVEQILGARPGCYRPPYGDVDARVDGLAASIGMARVGWNVAPNDYLSPPPEVLVDNVMARAAELPGQPLVVVLHDGGGNRAATLAALPGMIESLTAAGYSFVSVC
jgi:peptidoglycan/xylan/chitin deacetylase (PgdA/CDA1 family)